MKNLYSFKKTAFHVKAFKFIWGSDPTEVYKTMCPYFWTWVATLFIFPIILLGRMVMKDSSKIIERIKERQKKRSEIKLKKLISKAEKIIENKDFLGAFKLHTNRCWKSNKYDIDYVIRGTICDMYYKENKRRREENYKKKEEAYEKRSERIHYIKEHPSENLLLYSGLIVSALTALSTVLYLLYALLFYIIGFIGDNSESFLIAFCIIIGVTLSILAFLHIIIPLVKALHNKITCCPSCMNMISSTGRGLKKTGLLIIINPISYLFRNVALGVTIIADMIYNFYKKQCPIITWEDDKK
jgi:ABC-type multidrug transport system fused ATPase/permease subunit